MKKRQFSKDSYKKKIGYSAAIGAILTSMPMSIVNAEGTEVENIEEAIIAEQSTEKEKETTLDEIFLTEDITQAITMTHEAVNTYENNQEFTELLQSQTEQLLNEAKELHMQSKFDEAASIYSLLLELNIISSEYIESKNNIELSHESSSDDSDQKILNEEVKENDEISSSEEPVEKLNESDKSEKVSEDDDTNKDEMSDTETNSDPQSQEPTVGDYNNQLEEINNKESIKGAESLYQKAMTAAYASQAWQLANEGYTLFPNDDRFLDAVDNAGNRMLTIGLNSHKFENFSRAIEYYDEILNNQFISISIKEKAELNKTFANKNTQVKKADDIFNESISAPYASQAWELSIHGSEMYPNDNRFSKAITQAAQRMMIIGTNSHKSGNFLRAIDYYNQLIESPLVPLEIKKNAKSQESQAEKDLDLKKADNLYKQAITARYASEAWSSAVEGFTSYPKDSRFLDAIAQAADRMMTIGTNSHKSGDFVRAIEYYDNLVSVTAVPSSLKRQVELQRKQADSKQIIMSADDYYHKAINAPYASQAWGAAVEGINLYPKDDRFIKAINIAGERILTIGIDSHRSGNFKRATEYYDNLISRSELPSHLVNQASIFKGQAQSNVRFKTSNEYYKEATSAHYASQAWAAATEGNLIFPNDKRFVKAIDLASRRILRIGRDNHEKKSFETATDFYKLLLNHTEVSTDVKNMAQTLNGYSSKGKAIKTESVYVKEIKAASYASQAWDVAVEAISIYENNEKVSSALLEAANRQIQLGRQYEKAGDISRAKPYYDRVSNQASLPLSIRKLAASYSRLTQPSYRPVIYVDAGHGGSDSGAYFGGVKESILNISTAKFLKAELLKRGYDVVMSRESDVHLTLEERSTKANAHDIDILLSIHNNSMGGRGTAQGIETFIYHRVPSGYGQERDRDKFVTINPRVEDSLRLADYTHNQLIKQTGLNQRYVKGQNFHMVREPYLPSVLYELGFMDNPTELAQIKQVSFHKQSALAIADGVDAYFKK